MSRMEEVPLLQMFSACCDGIFLEIGANVRFEKFFAVDLVVGGYG